MIFSASFFGVPHVIFFNLKCCFFSRACKIIEQKGLKNAYMKNLCFEKVFHMMV